MELILLEESCVPEQLQIVLSKATILDDEYVLTHNTVFSALSSCKDVSLHLLKFNKSPQMCAPTISPSESCDCFYCNVKSHLIASCLVLKHKGARQQSAIKMVNQTCLMFQPTV